MKLTMKLLALFFGMLMLANAANAESPREQLKQMVEQLQKSPNDNTLREKIIKLAHGLKPALAMPDEAERRMARGTEAFKEAKSTADYQAAVKEFQQATLAAPWSGDAYFNLGLAQDKAEDYEGSLRSLKLAQLASPDSKDIKDLYYKVEYQRDKFAEQNSAAAKEAARQAAIYQGLDGGVWLFQMTPDWSEFIEIHGKQMTMWREMRANTATARRNPSDVGVRNGAFEFTFGSRQDVIQITHKYSQCPTRLTDYKINISPDGQTINESSKCSNEPGYEYLNTFNRIR